MLHHRGEFAHPCTMYHVFQSHEFEISCLWDRGFAHPCTVVLHSQKVHCPYSCCMYILRPSLIGHVDGVRRLKTAANNGPIVHPPGDM
jgi:hypothetical protein